MHYTFAKEKFRALCALHDRTNPTPCVPPLQPLDPPRIPCIWLQIHTDMHIRADMDSKKGNNDMGISSLVVCDPTGHMHCLLTKILLALVQLK